MPRSPRSFSMNWHLLTLLLHRSHPHIKVEAMSERASTFTKFASYTHVKQTEVHTLIKAISHTTLMPVTLLPESIIGCRDVANGSGSVHNRIRSSQDCMPRRNPSVVSSSLLCDACTQSTLMPSHPETPSPSRKGIMNPDAKLICDAIFDRSEWIQIMLNLGTVWLF